jgi:hypothetical protein
MSSQAVLVEVRERRYEKAIIFQHCSPKMMFMSGSVAPAPTDATKAATMRTRSRCEEYESTRCCTVSLLMLNYIQILP